MGIIIKQSIKGSIWSYVGVAIGFITTAYLYPNYLSTEVVGLFGLLVAWSILGAQFASLGFSGVTSRLFPYFRNQRNGHNGYLTIVFVTIIIGFVLFLVAYFLFSPWLSENNSEKSQLFLQYIYLLIPLTFFTLIYNQLDAFNRLLYNAVYGTFLTEFVQRLLILFSLLLFILGWISLQGLILFFVAAISAKGIIILFHLLTKGELKITYVKGFIDKKLRNEMFNVAVFSILNNVGGHLIFSLDKILINQILGLSATGIYTIASFFGTLILIPSRPLQRISGTLIAEAWKKKDISYISDIYTRSCLNQFIIGAFLFGGIWINIGNIITILGPEYEAGKWVIFFIGLGILTNMATGANAVIIAYSKYYKTSLWFLFMQIIVFVAGILILVPLWGLPGAGISIALSFFVNNVARYIFLYKKYDMQPFSLVFLIIPVAFSGAYILSSILPRLPLFWDIAVRSIVFSVIYIGVIIVSKVSGDINTTIKTFMRKLNTGKGLF